MKPYQLVPAAVEPDTRSLTSADGTAIYAEAVGDPSNPHLVFMHGYSVSTVVFDHIFYNQLYVKQFYLVRYDMRGHGRSGKPHDVKAFVSERLAQDFAAVMEAFSLKRPVFAGWSLGANVVADIVAHLPPNTISGAVYIGGLPHTGMAQRVVTKPALKAVAIFHRNDNVARHVSMKIPFIAGIFPHPDVVPYELKCLWAGVSLNSTPFDLQLAFNRPQNPKALLNAARDGTLPLLLLHGDRDAVIDCKSLLWEIQAIPWKNAEIVIMEGVGHGPFYERTESVMEHIGKFASRVQAGRHAAKL